MRILIALIVSLAPALVWADAYKCVGTDGTVTYADRPCGPKAQAIEVPYEPGDPWAGYERLDQARATLREIHRQTNLTQVEREIHRSRVAITRYEHARAERLAQLQAERRRLSEARTEPVNVLPQDFAISAGLDNVADATRDVSIAEEMQAVNQRYSSLISQERAELDMRFKERRILMGQ